MVRESKLQEFDRRIGEQRDKGVSIAAASTRVGARMVKEQCEARKKGRG